MRYPNPQKTRNFIERIPQHLHRLDYNAVKIECNSYFPTVPIFPVDFTNKQNFFNRDDPQGSNLIYRAQLIEGDALPHSCVARLSYNPNVEEIKNYGRLNKPKESIFYGSTNERAACSELISKNYLERKTHVFNFTVGVWEFVNPLRFAIIPHSDKWVKYLNEKHSAPSKVVTPDKIAQLNDTIKKDFDSDIEYEVWQFFADEFAKLNIKNDNDYFITNFYAETIFGESSTKFDGIMYPSVCSSYEVYNLALKPECVEKNLKFLYAHHVKRIDFTNQSEYIPIKQNVKANANGKLLWKETGFAASRLVSQYNYI